MAAYEHLRLDRYTRTDTATAAGPSLEQLIDAARADPLPVLETVAAPRRDRLWEISSNLHCSIIGTCLTTADLRTLLVKLGEADARTLSEHALHGRAVARAEHKNAGGKLLHKLLDRRHAREIARLDRVRDGAGLRAFWREAVDRGEIPGAYWAVLTHPLTDRALVQEVFGEVHMLSHLVGRAVRADLRRLAALEERLVQRDETVAELEARVQALTQDKVALAARLAGAERATAPRPERPPVPAAEPDPALRLERLERAEAHAAAQAERRAALEQAAAGLAEALREAGEREAELRAERDALEAALGAQLDDPDAAPAALDGLAVLYVGGRPRQVAQARHLVARRGGTLLSHDGGIEDAPGLLPGLVARADRVLFPVDCVSHDAALTVKRLCREGGPPLVPLRSASLAALVAALGTAGNVRPIAGRRP